MCQASNLTAIKLPDKFPKTHSFHQRGLVQLTVSTASAVYEIYISTSEVL
jgi:hypothetical protein